MWSQLGRKKQERQTDRTRTSPRGRKEGRSPPHPHPLAGGWAAEQQAARVQVSAAAACRRARTLRAEQRAWEDALAVAGADGARGGGRRGRQESAASAVPVLAVGEARGASSALRGEAAAAGPWASKQASERAVVVNWEALISFFA